MRLGLSAVVLTSILTVGASDFALASSADVGGEGLPVLTSQHQRNTGTAQYQLLAWSELGMHCIDGKDYSIFAVLPPYNIVHAQLIKMGEPPQQITSGVT